VKGIRYSSRPQGMGTRNDDIVGVDRREIEFTRMRSEMARAERQDTLTSLCPGRDLDIQPTSHRDMYAFYSSKTVDIAPQMNMQ